MYPPFLTSVVWNGPVPTMSGGFWNEFWAALGLTLDQMCSGTIGTHMPSMLALGVEQTKRTVRGSTAITRSMPTV